MFWVTRFLSDASLSGLGKSFRGAGEAFESMIEAWVDELEVGHSRGTERPKWLEEKQLGVLDLAADILQTKVENGMGKLPLPSHGLT